MTASEQPSPSAHRPPRRPLGWWLAAVALVAATALLAVFDPAQHAFYPQCQLHRLTGLDCPACGSLRAVHQLAHGDLPAAWRLNPLLVGLLPLLAYEGMLRLTGRPWSRSLIIRPPVAGALLGVALLFGVLRNLPAAAFAWLGP